LQRRPFVVVDGAHNADSAQKLAAALNDYFPGRRVILIFGASSDKDIAGMFRELLPRAAHVIMAQAVHPRALEPEELARLAAPYPPVVEKHTQVGGALERALQLASSEDVILACGSLFIVAEIRAAHQTRVPNVG
jgi:dihydrofolate synthase/folylpolyglutamate synthase